MLARLTPASGLQGPDPGGGGFEAAEEGVRVAVGRLLRRLGKLGLWRTSAQPLLPSSSTWDKCPDCGREPLA